MYGTLISALKGISTQLGSKIAPQLAKGSGIHNAMSHGKMQLAFTGLIAVSGMSPEEKKQAIGTSLALFWLTGGSTSMLRQASLQAGLSVAQHAPELGRMYVTGIRSNIETRTMAVVPFSHSTANMDLALSSMQYTHSQMANHYSILGSESAMYSARYLQR